MIAFTPEGSGPPQTMPQWMLDLNITDADVARETLALQHENYARLGMTPPPSGLTGKQLAGPEGKRLMEEGCQPRSVLEERDRYRKRLAEGKGEQGWLEDSHSRQPVLEAPSEGDASDNSGAEGCSDERHESLSSAFCRNCGAKVLREDNFCGACGKELSCDT